MAVHLKSGATQAGRSDRDRTVRDTVETILADVESRGDVAARELSRKVDGWERESFRPTPSEIQGCMDQLSRQDLHPTPRPW